MRVAQVFICLLLVGTAGAQTRMRQNLAAILGFENGAPGAYPAGWNGSAGIVIDDRVVHSGRYSARLERSPSSSGTFSSLTVSIPVDFTGSTITWRGYLKTEDVSGYAGIYMREDGASGTLAFATTQGLRVNGTTDWTQYSISVSVSAEAKLLYLGVLLSGTGKAWVDDLECLVDGRPVAQAAPRITTPLDTDHAFDGGSGIALESVSPTQTENLALLAKVWGFLKYHHPAIAGGKHHWDYELFRVLPAVFEAPDRTTAASAISAWLDGLGSVPACTECASLDRENLALAPDLEWISDASLLGAGLSETLQAIYRNRPVGVSTFYVSFARTSNPTFDHELAYPSLRFPDSGYQLLALFRFWNMVQYFSPNRDIMFDEAAGDPGYWDRVLAESIPRFALAKEKLAFQQELLRFITKINDTHANLWSSLSARPPLGSCRLPVSVRFVEEQPVVVSYTSDSAGPESGLKAGDLIERLDDVPVSELMAQWRPFYAASNEAARLRDIGRYMTVGPCGTATVTVRRDGEEVRVEARRVLPATLDLTYASRHDRPGETFQKLTDDVAYLKLSSVKSADSARYIDAAAGTKGLIIDIRNYPSEFVVFTLGGRLVPETTPFAIFTYGDASNPGAFRKREPVTLAPLDPRYTGKVVILIDETTQSQAEYTTMAFRAAPCAVVIGSTTAGADGNVSTVPIPGGMSSYISGLGVYYPDGRPTQRVGIIPDIEVRPTIAGIRDGRDELLEAAMRVILEER